MGVLAKIEAFLDGKKTYIVAILTGIIGIYSMYHAVPDVVWSVLGMLGLGAIRSAIGNNTQPPAAGTPS